MANRTTQVAAGGGCEKAVMLPVVPEHEDISPYEPNVYNRTTLTEATKRDREGVVMLLRRGGY